MDPQSHYSRAEIALALTYLLEIDKISSSLPRYQARKNCFDLMKFEECSVFDDVMA